jgi:hypothetical protein
LVRQCILLEAERYEIYPTHYYTLNSERKPGQWEISSTPTALHTHFHPLLRFAEVCFFNSLHREVTYGWSSHTDC